ncbi:uncharacterized protein VTP21DRAFT_1656 [Calcarisporiella thermophila]|uniref:uncharacterized protein n=1 Tax=Calcarisporiella thermophila TaxID=911321 RepID=UPI00374221C7
MIWSRRKKRTQCQRTKHTDTKGNKDTKEGVAVELEWSGNRAWGACDHKPLGPMLGGGVMHKNEKSE